MTEVGLRWAAALDPPSCYRTVVPGRAATPRGLGETGSVGVSAVSEGAGGAYMWLLAIVLNDFQIWGHSKGSDTVPTPHGSSIGRTEDKF